MKLKIKIRLRMLRDKLSEIFTTQIREALFYTFVSFIFAGGLISLVTIGYMDGFTDGVNSMQYKHETDIPMCVYKDTAIRENPTGYILSEIPAGNIVWVVQLQVPFAVVWYFDGTNWHLGTTTASYLVPCDRITRESL